VYDVDKQHSFEYPLRDWSGKLGVALIMLGIVALATMKAYVSNPAILFGWLVVASGVAEAAHAFHVRRTDRFFLHIVPALAGVPIGLLISTHPAAGEMAWMLLFASFFTVLGLFRIVAAVRLQFPNWQWTVFDGVATFLLGTLLWAAWPWGTWFFGFAVGISMILRGWSTIMFSVGVRRLRKTTASPTPIRKAEVQPSTTQYNVRTTNVR
jgi:uncharacterized membrane protein HdeD (DUF308 family)